MSDDELLRFPAKMSDDLLNDKETALREHVLGPAPSQYGRVARLDWSLPSGNRSVVVERASVIGSAKAVDVVIEDPAVSRLHAELEPREDGVWIRDLGSKNGTWVQGVRVESAQVPHLGRVKLGGVDLVVTYGAAAAAKPETWSTDRFGPLVGGSRAMRELFARLSKVASSDASLLVTGETGTGKELVARAIHESSSRKSGPLVIVDCAALPQTLLDAELFGHAKGAFTGAGSARAGAIEAADGGTVFLDEIGELPHGMQPKLLRVLEAKTVRRIGETNHRPVDVRFISATHRDLLTMVNAGEFREDLYFRLAVLPVRVPSLRERMDDVEMLVRHFYLTGSPRDADSEAKAISPELLAEIAARPWRGNVRELRNFVERVRILGATEALSLSNEALMSVDRSSGGDDRDGSAGVGGATNDASVLGGAAAPRFDQPYRAFRDEWHELGERAYVNKLLEAHGQNVAEAATNAEIDRTYLYKLIRKYTR